MKQFCSLFTITLIFLISLLPFKNGTAHAATFTVIGPCSASPVLQIENLTLPDGISLGDFTVQTLIEAQTPFTGSNEGIESILNSPKGKDALEILTPSKMRAYGWCFTVDGIESNLMPNELMLKNKSTNIVWFYASALAENGNWKDYCQPSYKTHSPFICH